MGRFSSFAISNYPNITKVTIADLNEDNAKEFSNFFDDRFTGIGLDVTDKDLSNRRIKDKKKASGFERLHHRIDDVLFYCKACNRVWQYNRKMMSRKWESYPSNNIPILGKQKKECPNCKEKK